MKDYFQTLLFIYFRKKFHFVTCSAVLVRQLLQQISYAGRLNKFSTKARGMSTHCTVTFFFCKRNLTYMKAKVKGRCCTTLTPQLVKLLYVAPPDSDTG
jgi:hypothetical protein